MAPGLPLPTLLSQVLVAFTVELDNEFEHRMSHRTTAGRPNGAPKDAPWLASQVMWANVLRYIEPGGTGVGHLHHRSRTTSDSLAGLRRWGYVTVDPFPERGRGGRVPDESVVRTTSGGRKAQAVWRPLGAEIEERWRERFGTGAVDGLHQALGSLTGQFDRPLPDYLPVVHPTSNGKAEPQLSNPARSELDLPDPGRRPDLSVLVSQVLLGFTLEFESGSRISLPISANTLRVLDPTGVRVRDLLPLTGVSKEANAMAVGFLVRHGCAEVVADPAATRSKVVRLTGKGQTAQAKYGRILAITEERFRARYGPGTVASLRRSLEELTGERPAGPDSLLVRGMEPYPDGWRASVRRPDGLPHYPMVLHRGGFPDGS
jgi:DNA-binding MarR family transcriptional regulator